MTLQALIDMLQRRRKYPSSTVTLSHGEALLVLINLLDYQKCIEREMQQKGDAGELPYLRDNNVWFIAETDEEGEK